jgi:putative tricarboxylic transport membrane protein
MTFDLVLWILLGTVAGIAVGSVPGLTGAMASARTLPQTLAMEPEAALALLVSMYVGSVSGGLITATLLRMPGTPASIMTTLDAYPMAARGEARRALALGIGASLAGGLIAWLVLVLLARPVASVAVKLHPFDLFALVAVALVLVAVISRGDLARGLLSACLGMLATLPGIEPATGQPRWTFGIPDLADGFKLLPVLIGLFAIAEVVRLAARPRSEVPETLSAKGGRLPSLREWLRQGPNLLRSGAIGSFVGVLPGIGANIGSLLAYGAAKAVSRTPSDFGKGSPQAIVASESANNATVGGALVPLIALGIPGSVVDAILLGAFVIHGLQPGPLLFENSPHIVESITRSYLLANFVMAAAMILGLRWLPRLMRVPTHLLVPVVLAFCVVGSYALASRVFDVAVMLAFGALGLLMGRLRIPLAPFVLGFVLAPMAEKNLSVGLMMTGGSLAPLLTRPACLGMILVAMGLLVVPLLVSRCRGNEASS